MLNPLFIKKKTLLLTLAVTSLLSTTGCSNFSKAFGYTDSVAQDDNYRVTQDALITPLELPPGFQNPNRNMDNQNRQLIGQLNDKLKTDIPSFKVDGLSVNSNLSERWLHIHQANANDIWTRLEKFLNNQGFSLEESRKDIGLMRTQYVARKDIVPKNEMGFLTRVLNSWRAETAQGALDRLTLRLQSDAQGGVDIFFRHSMMIETGDSSGVTTWRSRPYHPEFEAEMMYQALVYLGSSKEFAHKQIETSVKTLENSLDGEFHGLNLLAGKEEAWQHLLSLADRANFTIINADKANGQMTIKLPKNTTQEQSFFTRLFASGEKQLPETLGLRFKTEQGRTEIIPNTLDDQSLTQDQRKQIFQLLGLLP
jgi:outer membrane protein assembly factor BamC